jgi:hypothetical protein
VGESSRNNFYFIVVKLVHLETAGKSIVAGDEVLSTLLALENMTVGTVMLKGLVCEIPAHDLLQFLDGHYNVLVAGLVVLYSCHVTIELLVSVV